MSLMEGESRHLFGAGAGVSLNGREGEEFAHLGMSAGHAMKTVTQGGKDEYH
jgi:hypothetical protein